MNSSRSIPPSREAFDEFLQVFTHEVRNRLNGIALEAADLEEQSGGTLDTARLQQRVRECADFLKIVRDLLAYDEPGSDRLPLGEVIARLQARDLPAAG